ncbi:HAD-IA family hydrolase [Streptomyces sp. NPDC046931]|uniref:HAD family hydrolase n=1 Tax=Streptomyces sp. NPDC046931 TaxID=3154806 RepID=UPI0033CE9549
MAIKGVLFDFSGTLFRIESTESWLRAVVTEAGLALSQEELVHTAERLESAGALAGGALPTAPMSDELATLWAVRDRSSEAHRAAFTGLSRQVPLPDPRLHDALYDRHMTPDAWRPYPDTIEVLRSLRERGVAVGVVSNIGWDLRPVFHEHGVAPYVDTFVLSYEHGIQKPDTRLFALACDALGLAPQDTLMVGDDRHADGGAADLGCTVHFVDHRPVSERPDGLRPVLDLIG